MGHLGYLYHLGWRLVLAYSLVFSMLLPLELELEILS
jgi:hypothetical protein